MTEDPAGRRRFFRYMARETVVWFEQLCGRPHILISDIARLPPEVLTSVIPRMRPGLQIIAGVDRVSARLPDGDRTVELLPCDEANLFVFNRFNGQNGLGQISAELAAAMSWPPERSFAFVRDLFLRLLALQVCVPANELPSPELI